MNGRELKRNEKVKINRLVAKHCASFDEEYGCLPLDGECYMKTVGFNDSPMCKYFQQSVLPLDAEVQKIFYGGEVEVCRYCGTVFPKNGKRQYCSDHCNYKARRNQVRDANFRYRHKRDKT